MDDEYVVGPVVSVVRYPVKSNDGRRICRLELEIRGLDAADSIHHSQFAATAGTRDGACQTDMKRGSATDPSQV